MQDNHNPKKDEMALLSLSDPEPCKPDDGEENKCVHTE